jgi:hypothetical protein
MPQPFISLPKNNGMYDRMNFMSANPNMMMIGSSQQQDNELREKVNNQERVISFLLDEMN